MPKVIEPYSMVRKEIMAIGRRIKHESRRIPFDEPLSITLETSQYENRKYFAHALMSQYIISNSVC